MTEYSIDRTRCKALRVIAESDKEVAAIDRLEEFRGCEQDVRLAAALYQRAGDGENAAELLRMLPPAPTAGDLARIRLRELALEVAERLIGKNRVRIAAAVDDTDPDDDARAIRNDYHCVRDALTSACAPLVLELRDMRAQRDRAREEVQRVTAERDAARGQLKALSAAITTTAAEAQKAAGRIGGDSG
jgi:hypothetical protein